MANPELENGYTRIANELLEKLAGVHLSPSEWQVLLCIIRLSYGYSTKAGYVTGPRVARMTRILKPNVYRALRGLAARGMIVWQGKKIGLQKDWERWVGYKEEEPGKIILFQRDRTQKKGK